jgi:hypothetical protein
MSAHRSNRLASLAALTALAACGTCTPPTPPTVTVPDALRTPPGESLQRTLWATGAQIYECRPKAAAAMGAASGTAAGTAAGTAPAAGSTEWAFVGPEATLADAQGAIIGKHYAGPTWEARDGSKVVGTVKARVDAPDAGAIPWLLLETRNVGKGTGLFARVTSVQRVATVGGLPPAAAGCTSATIGQKARVDYKAEYVMYAPTF